MFANRKDAGRQLAAKLTKYTNAPNTIVLALPRGGIEIGAVIAHTLGLPLDVIITRKIGAPNNSEFAIAAVSEHGLVINSLYSLIDEDYLQASVIKERQEIARRRQLYRQGRPPLPIAGKAVILVDDGIATGLTLQAAVAELRRQNVTKIILAVPVAPADNIDVIRLLADETIILSTPADFQAVGQFYTNFPQLSDDQVIELLASCNH